MAPPVCSKCSKILSGTYYSTGQNSYCAACGAKLQAGAGKRRIVTAIAMGGCGALMGNGIQGLYGTSWGYVAAPIALVVGLLLPRPPVIGPKPMGNTLPPPGQV